MNVSKSERKVTRANILGRRACWLGIASSLVMTGWAYGAQTTGGVTWSDPLGYTKPTFHSISVPDESAAAHTYWVDLGSGSGSTCSKAAPCTWSGISGKAGIADATGAYVHIKGSGTLSDISIIGRSGAEVVIKPWDDNTTATVTGRNNWAGNKQWLVFDGGPNMQIRFRSTAGGQFDPSIYFYSTSANQHDITFHRTRWSVPGAGLWMASYGRITNLYLINNEFEALESSVKGQQHHIYMSQYQSGGQPLNGFFVLNNIFRDTPAEAIELRMAAGSASLTNLVVDGNAFHDIGKGTCSAGWGCRSAITFSREGGGSFSLPMRVSNNMIWDTGEGCLRTWDNPSGMQVYGNTCWNWGSGSSATGRYSSVAFSNYSFTDPPGIFVNNALYAAGKDANGNDKEPFPSGASSKDKSYNACESGESCGTSAQANLTDASFASLNENNPAFLKLVDGSSPIGAGTVGSGACVSPDYLGLTRSQADSCDIGAFAATGISVPVPLPIPQNPTASASN